MNDKKLAQRRAAKELRQRQAARGIQNPPTATIFSCKSELTTVRMLFDEHNHPVDSKTVSAEKRARCQWKRCYIGFAYAVHGDAADIVRRGGKKIIEKIRRLRRELEQELKLVRAP